MRTAEQFAPLQAVGFQVLLDDLLTSAFSLDDRVRELQELLLSQSGFCHWMSPIHEAHETVTEQALLEDIGSLKIRKVSHGQVNFSALQRGREVARRHGHSDDVNPGGMVARLPSIFGRKVISPRSDIAIVNVRCAVRGTKSGARSTFSRTLASNDWTLVRDLPHARKAARHRETS